MPKTWMVPRDPYSVLLPPSSPIQTVADLPAALATAFSGNFEAPRSWTRKTRSAVVVAVAVSLRRQFPCLHLSALPPNP